MFKLLRRNHHFSDHQGAVLLHWQVNPIIEPAVVVGVIVDHHLQLTADIPSTYTNTDIVGPAGD